MKSGGQDWLSQTQKGGGYQNTSREQENFQKSPLIFMGHGGQILLASPS